MTQILVEDSLFNNNPTGMKIIGISGKIGAGKDTLALAMQHICSAPTLSDAGVRRLVNRKVFPEASMFDNQMVAVKFADPLRSVISILTGMPPRDLEKREVKESMMPERFGPITYRQYMQRVGQGMRDVDPNAWINAYQSKAEQYPLVVTADTRYHNEAEFIKRSGGVVVRLERRMNLSEWWTLYDLNRKYLERRLDGVAADVWTFLDAARAVLPKVDVFKLMDVIEHDSEVDLDEYAGFDCIYQNVGDNLLPLIRFARKTLEEHGIIERTTGSVSTDLEGQAA